jgi:hypothetical protein
MDYEAFRQLQVGDILAADFDTKRRIIIDEFENINNRGVVSYKTLELGLKETEKQFVYVVMYPQHYTKIGNISDLILE